LRKDPHELFDAGYVTATPSVELRVSRRLREEFENGRDYYAVEDASVRASLPPARRPHPNTSNGTLNRSSAADEPSSRSAGMTRWLKGQPLLEISPLE
jgi:hypothetical protein